jgi:hypothetical protein
MLRSIVLLSIAASTAAFAPSSLASSSATAMRAKGMNGWAPETESAETCYGLPGAIMPMGRSYFCFEVPIFVLLPSNSHLCSFQMRPLVSHLFICSCVRNTVPL